MKSTVLVVEDDVFLAECLAEAIESELGLRVQQQHSLRAALQDMSALPHFAVLDIDLGDGKVFPVADHLAKASVPFVFLSGSRSDDLPERFRPFPFLSKPFNERLLLKLIASSIKA